MNYIFLDTEFNQPNFFGKPSNFTPNKTCPFELIEIGAVKLDGNFNEIDNFRMFIKPQIYRSLSPLVIRKTKITKEDLKYGFYFNKVMDIFIKWIGNDYILCVWSENDILELKRNCKYHKYYTDWMGEKYIDVQADMGRYMCLSSGHLIGLDKAVEVLDIKLDNKFHRALDDARYTSLVFKTIKDNIKEFTLLSPTDVIGIKKITFNDLPLLDKKRLRINCAKCGRFIVAEDGALTKNRRTYINFGICKNCNTITSQRIKIRKSDDEENIYFYDNPRKAIVCPEDVNKLIESLNKAKNSYENSKKE